MRCVTQSTADYGLGGYGIHLVPPLVTYVGREAVDVAAGTFQGLHFRVRWSDQVPEVLRFLGQRRLRAIAPAGRLR